MILLVSDVDGDLQTLDHWLEHYADACMMTGDCERAEMFRAVAKWIREIDGDDG